MATRYCPKLIAASSFDGVRRLDDTRKIIMLLRLRVPVGVEPLE